MSGSFRGNPFDLSNVFPSEDASIFSFLNDDQSYVMPNRGLGMNVTRTGHVITVQPGEALIQGRRVALLNAVSDTATPGIAGQVILQIDLSQANTSSGDVMSGTYDYVLNQASVIVRDGNAAPRQDPMHNGGTVFQIILATYTSNAQQVTLTRNENVYAVERGVREVRNSNLNLLVTTGTFRVSAATGRAAEFNFPIINVPGFMDLHNGLMQVLVGNDSDTSDNPNTSFQRRLVRQVFYRSFMTAPADMTTPERNVQPSRGDMRSTQVFTRIGDPTAGTAAQVAAGGMWSSWEPLNAYGYYNNTGSDNRTNNLNNLVAVGWYNINRGALTQAQANWPVNITTGYLEVQRGARMAGTVPGGTASSGTSVIQTFYRRNGALTAVQQAERWTRRLLSGNPGAWTQWVRSAAGTTIAALDSTVARLNDETCDGTYYFEAGTNNLVLNIQGAIHRLKPSSATMEDGVGEYCPIYTSTDPCGYVGDTD